MGHDCLVSDEVGTSIQFCPIVCVLGYVLQNSICWGDADSAAAPGHVALHAVFSGKAILLP